MKRLFGSSSLPSRAKETSAINGSMIRRDRQVKRVCSYLLVYESRIIVQHPHLGPRFRLVCYMSLLMCDSVPSNAKS
jgi:hypothetical protein